MSLQEAYTSAHTAQSRLKLAASRPDGNLRFVVGHLMHYEALRLRIVEIEHELSQSARAEDIQFGSTGYVGHRLQRKSSTRDLRRKSSSPPPPPQSYHDEDTDEDEYCDDDYMADDDDDEEEDLSLSRFPSGSVRLLQSPPGLIPDDPAEEDLDFDEPVSAEELGSKTMEQGVKSDSPAVMATLYEGVRQYVCNENARAPLFQTTWGLPPDESTKEGITRAITPVNDQLDPRNHGTQPLRTPGQVS